MKKIQNLITLKQSVTFPLEEMKNHTIEVNVIFDLRGQEITKGTSEEDLERMLKATVFNCIPDVMATYIAIAMTISAGEHRDIYNLEKKLYEHLKELKKISESALEKEMKNQEDAKKSQIKN
jgi:RNase adaptor protein for sRNA GlmZ degradation